jgi:hypothetical protein
VLHAFARARAVPSATALKSVFILHHLAGGIERMEEFTLFDRDLRVRAQCPQNVLFRLWSCQALSRRRQSRFDRCGAWDCHARVHRNTLRGPRHFEGGPAPVRRRSARRISVLRSAAASVQLIAIETGRELVPLRRSARRQSQYFSRR